MDILYFQGVRRFRLEVGGLSYNFFTSKGYHPLPWEGQLSWTSFISKGYHPVGLGGDAIMGILHFQGGRTLEVAEGEL